MSFRSNVVSIKCCFDQVSFDQVSFDQVSLDQMSFRSSIARSGFVRSNVVSVKCRFDQISFDQVSFDQLSGHGWRSPMAAISQALNNTMRILHL